MKILVIGSGGREHALVWKLAQSSSVEKIWCAPGNGGIESDAECFPLDLSDVRAASELAARLGADLTIVGPEIPLVAGIADERHAGIGQPRIVVRLEIPEMNVRIDYLHVDVPHAAMKVVQGRWKTGTSAVCTGE